MTAVLYKISSAFSTLFDCSAYHQEVSRLLIEHSIILMHSNVNCHLLLFPTVSTCDQEVSGYSERMPKGSDYTSIFVALFHTPKTADHHADCKLTDMASCLC